MRLMLAVLAACLLCGCLGGDDGGPDEISVNLTQDPYAVPTTLKRPTTTLAATTSTEPATTLKPTTTSSTTSTVPATTTTLPRRPWPTLSVTTSTTSTTASTTTSSTTTTLRCTEVCADIRIPSPRNCMAGCCISAGTSCEYVPRDGGKCRCA